VAGVQPFVLTGNTRGKPKTKSEEATGKDQRIGQKGITNRNSIRKTTSRKRKKERR